MILCMVCRQCGRDETLPFDECRVCGEAPAYHHDRCCPGEQASGSLATTGSEPVTGPFWTVRVAERMAARRWPPRLQAQVQLLEDVGRRLHIRCPGCNGIDYSTTGSNQFYLRLKCARCKVLLANPRVPSITEWAQGRGAAYRSG